MKRFVVALSVCLAVGAGYAGTKLGVPVTIDATIQSAWGALGTARNGDSTSTSDMLVRRGYQPAPHAEDA